MCERMSKKSRSHSTSSHLPILSHTDLHISSIVSALLFGITFSDLKRFFAVSLPFAPLVRERFNELHSLGVCSIDAGPVDCELLGVGLVSGICAKWLMVWCRVSKGADGIFLVCVLTLPFSVARPSLLR